MKKYRFEIQNLIQVEVEAENQDDARILVIYKLENDYYDMTKDAYVSQGQEVEDK